MPKARRARGDGGLVQRHDHPSCPPLIDGRRPEHRCRGRWVGTLMVEDPATGQRRRKSVYGRTHAQAKARLDKARGAAARGELVLRQTTLAAWLDYWLSEIAPLRTKPQTLAGYRSKVRTVIVPHLGAHRLDRLRPEHIRAWHRTLRESGGRRGTPLAEASVRQAHAILKRALRDAVNDGKLATSPADRVDSPRTVQRERIGLTVEQARHLLDVAGPDARWWLAVFYGLRQGEALGLRWGDVDFDSGILSIRRTLQRDGRDWVFGTPKTAKAERDMPMLPQVALALRLTHPVGADPDALVFADEHGGPIRPWTDNRAWHDLLDRAGLPSLPLHAARHTASSVLEAAGVAERVVMQILGHSQVQTTRRYTHADLARLRGALQAAGELLASERPFLGERDDTPHVVGEPRSEGEHTET